MVPQSDVAFDGVHDEIAKGLLMFSGCWKYHVLSNLKYSYVCNNVLLNSFHLTHACTLNTSEEIDSS